MILEFEQIMASSNEVTLNSTLLGINQNEPELRIGHYLSNLPHRGPNGGLILLMNEL